LLQRGKEKVLSRLNDPFHGHKSPAKSPSISLTISSTLHTLLHQTTKSERNVGLRLHVCVDAVELAHCYHMLESTVRFQNDLYALLTCLMILSIRHLHKWHAHTAYMMFSLSWWIAVECEMMLLFYRMVMQLCYILLLFHKLAFDRHVMLPLNEGFIFL
jgi:hypothetical protein